MRRRRSAMGVAGRSNTCHCCTRNWLHTPCRAKRSAEPESRGWAAARGRPRTPLTCNRQPCCSRGQGSKRSSVRPALLCSTARQLAPERSGVGSASSRPRSCTGAATAPAGISRTGSVGPAWGWASSPQANRMGSTSSNTHPQRRTSSTASTNRPTKAAPCRGQGRGSTPMARAITSRDTRAAGMDGQAVA